MEAFEVINSSQLSASQAQAIVQSVLPIFRQKPLRMVAYGLLQIGAGLVLASALKRRETGGDARSA
jgi:hypothetical protein